MGVGMEWEGGREGGGNWGGDMAVVSCRCHKDLKMMKGRKEGRRSLVLILMQLGSVHTYVCIPGPARRG